MLRSEAEDLMRHWSDKDGKIFKYFRPFMPDEYVVFIRDGDRYKCDKKTTTYVMRDVERNDFIKLLTSRELIFVKDYTIWGPSPLKMKTNGCDCGIWILKDNEYMHDAKCPCYKPKP